MKKFVIPFIIIIFGICAFFGYKVASKILSAKKSPVSLDTVSPNNPVASQKNFLFIHVNDLTLDKPELISIWVGFVNESDPPQFMFMPILPTYNAEVHDNIIQSFGLNSDKKISQRFIHKLKSTFDIDIHGYILSDDTGANYSTFWLTGVESPIASLSPVTDEAKHAILLNEQVSWQQFCQLTITGAANSFFSVINWGLLLPDHFSTNLDFESITLLTDQIVHATSQVQCEVLSTE